MEKELFIENAVKVHGNKYDYTNLPLTFRGIYDNNVYFMEDLLENNIQLIDIFVENIQNI